MLYVKYLSGTAIVVTLSYFFPHYTKKEEGLVRKRNEKM
jgi:hypothetical protein